MKDPRDGGVYADCWHIPGGGIDAGEDQLAALKREVLEETGIDISSATISLADDKGRGKAEKKLKNSGETVLCNMTFSVYRVDLPKDASEIELQPQDDLVKLEWIDMGDLPNYKLTPPSISLFTRLGYLAA
jgi:8-oxo-dGTP pyrophosphatase MutT (NUDIX family)